MKKQFHNCSAWFAKSVPRTHVDLWLTEGGVQVHRVTPQTLYLFSNNCNDPETTRLQEQGKVVYRSAWILDCHLAQGRKAVGPYILTTREALQHPSDPPGTPSLNHSGVSRRHSRGYLTSPLPSTRFSFSPPPGPDTVGPSPSRTPNIFASPYPYTSPRLSGGPSITSSTLSTSLATSSSLDYSTPQFRQPTSSHSWRNSLSGGRSTTSLHLGSRVTPPPLASDLIRAYSPASGSTHATPPLPPSFALSSGGSQRDSIYRGLSINRHTSSNHLAKRRRRLSSHSLHNYSHLDFTPSRVGNRYHDSAGYHGDTFSDTQSVISQLSAISNVSSLVSMHQEEDHLQRTIPRYRIDLANESHCRELLRDVQDFTPNRHGFAVRRILSKAL
ncbi:hypothetical protein IWQ61_001341 [Dispira simplex]|nr:hypothetical protein IWQ61_001341 [Dispira simplex]